MSEANWAGNYRYRAGKLHRPSRLEQVQEIVVNAPRVRVLGSRHSFTDVADSSELLTLDVRQRVFEGLGWDALLDNFDEITSTGYSVSVFTRWPARCDRCCRCPRSAPWPPTSCG